MFRELRKLIIEMRMNLNKVSFCASSIDRSRYDVSTKNSNKQRTKKEKEKLGIKPGCQKYLTIGIYYIYIYIHMRTFYMQYEFPMTR